MRSHGSNILVFLEEEKIKIHTHTQREDHVRLQRETSHPQAEGRGLRRNQSFQHPDLESSALGTMRNAFLLFKSSIYGTLSQQPQITNIPSKLHGLFFQNITILCQIFKQYFIKYKLKCFSIVSSFAHLCVCELLINIFIDLSIWYLVSFICVQFCLIEFICCYLY